MLIRVSALAALLALALGAPSTATADYVRFTFNLGFTDGEGVVRNEVTVVTFADKIETTANFLAYVNAELYDGLLVYRLARGFVLQTGGFYPNVQPEPIGPVNRARPVDLDGDPETPNPMVDNEYEVGELRSNVKGTLAMAKLGGLPDSATNEFFFSLADNSVNLDNQNGGFTVFAEVVDGQDVLDAFNASLNTVNLNPDDHTYIGEFLVLQGQPDGVRDPGGFGTIPFSGNQLLRITKAEVVPEPDGAQLAAAAFLAIALLRRRKRLVV